MQMGMSGGWKKLTRGGDIPSVFYNRVKHVADCRTVVIEVIRSSDGRWGIRSQGPEGGAAFAQAGLVEGEFPGRYIDFETPIKRDVTS